MFSKQKWFCNACGKEQNSVISANRWLGAMLCGFDERLFQEFMRDQSAGGYGLGQNTIVDLEFTDILWDDGKDYTGKPDYMVPRVRSMSPELKAVLEFLQKEFGDYVSLKFWW